MTPTYNYIDMILKLKEEFFLGDHSAIYMLACSVACISAGFALIALLNHINNDPWGRFDVKGLLRIFTVLLVVCNFYSVVLVPFDYLTSLVAKGVSASVAADAGSLQSKINQAYSSVETTIKEKTLRGQFESMVESGSSQTSLDNGAIGNSNSVFESNVESDIDSGDKPGFWSKVWGTVKGAVQDAMGFPYKAISNVLSWLISCIVDLTRCVLMLVSGMYLIVLGLLGPFVFALSIIPSFRGGIAGWIARYIQISFWVPVCSIIDYINFNLKDKLLDVFAGNNMVEQMVFPTVFLIFLDVATLSMLLGVPKISAWIIASDGSGLGGSVASVAQKAARLFGKAKV